MRIPKGMSLIDQKIHGYFKGGSKDTLKNRMKHHRLQTEGNDRSEDKSFSEREREYEQVRDRQYT